MTALALVERIEQARELLANCRTIEQWKLGADKAAAVLEFGRRHAAASNAHADAYELVQIANRCLGDCCRELPKGKRGPKPAKRAKGSASEAEPEIISRGENKSKGEALQELNLSPKMAAELERLSKMDEADFLAGVAGNRARIVEGKIPVSLTAKSSGQSYDSDAYGTPELVLECGREVLGGGFDLDPCSNAAAQKLVRAERFWTKADDCLQQKAWKAKRLWMNPPFSRVISEIVARLLAEVDAKHIAAGLVLVNNQTDTAWFHSMMRRYPTWFSEGRLAFVVDGKPLDNTRQGQAVFYIGPKLPLFRRVFEKKLGGKVLTP